MPSNATVYNPSMSFLVTA